MYFTFCLVCIPIIQILPTQLVCRGVLCRVVYFLWFILIPSQVEHASLHMVAKVVNAKNTPLLTSALDSKGGLLDISAVCGNDHLCVRIGGCTCVTASSLLSSPLPLYSALVPLSHHHCIHYHSSAC